MSLMFGVSLLSYITVTNTLVAIILGIFAYRYLRLWMLNLPPGPTGLPFVGVLPFMQSNAEKTFAKWANKYGPVIYVQLGSHWTVILNNYEAIDEAYNKQASLFSGRYHSYFTDFACEGYGIMFLDGEEKWKIQRKFGSKALSGTALQNRSIETRILEEAESLCNVIRSKNGKSFVLELDLIASVSNIINDITIKERCDVDGKEKFRAYITFVIEGFRRHGLIYSLLTVLPWSRFLPFVKKHVMDMREGIRVGNALFDGLIEKHDKDFDPKDIRDLTDAFLAKHKQKTPTFESLLQLRYYLKDLLAAGTETTSSTIRWVLLYLIKYPHVQERIHKELDEVLGSSGKVKLDLDLPYMKAVIQEGHRLGSVTPLSVPRRTVADVKLMGYHIPKNTQVLANLWAVHRDPVTWPDPEKFDPERHLDEDGKFVKLERVIPFSVGPRNCLGENLARAEVFLFLVIILQKFKVLPNPEQPMPCLQALPGVVASPSHYPLILKER